MTGLKTMPENSRFISDTSFGPSSVFIMQVLVLMQNVSSLAAMVFKNVTLIAFRVEFLLEFLFLLLLMMSS